MSDKRCFQTAAWEISATSCPGSAAPLDIGVLAALIGDDQGVIGEFLQDFRRHTAELAARIRSAFRRGEAKPLGLAAHTLKSSARSVGALRLGEICADIEKRATQNDPQALLDALLNFDREFAAVEEFLQTAC